MDLKEKSQMHCLVVCGATEADSDADAALFGDFLGLSMALQYLHADVSGTFLSCFPLNEHFEILGQQIPPIEDIKFGADKNGKALFTYSKSKHQSQKNQWYIHCSSQQLIAKVTNWILDKAASVKDGDAVTIFFHGHGDVTGSMWMGRKHMSTTEMRDLLRLFGFGVQVNIVVSYCHSGFLVNEIASDLLQPRNRFVAAPCTATEEHWTFKRSASGRCRNMTFAPGFVDCIRDPTMSLSELHCHLESFLMQKGYRQSTYTLHVTPDIDTETQVATLLKRKTADIKYLKTHPPRSGSAWPAMDLVMWKKMRPFHRALAESLVDEAISRSLSKDKDYPYSGVMGRMLRRPKKDYAYALEVLRHRTDLQTDVLYIFQLLQKKGLVTEEALVDPINLNTSNTNVARVLCTLRCFEEWSLDQFDKIGYEFIFDAPLKWLAVIIVRSNSDRQFLFTYLKEKKFLGEFYQLEYERISSTLGRSVENEDKAATECLTDPRPFGLALPILGGKDVKGAIEHSLSLIFRVTELHHEIAKAALTGSSGVQDF